MENKEPSLKVAVLDGRPPYSENLRDVLVRNGCKSVLVAKSIEEVVEALKNDQCNALIINLAFFGADASIALIDRARKDYSTFPICVIDNFATVLSHNHADWKERLGHYYSLPSDSGDDLTECVQLTIRLFQFYLHSQDADSRLRDLRAYLTSHDLQLSLKEKNQIIKFFLNVAEELMKSEQRLAQLKRAIIPGFESSSVSELINNTLERAKQSLDGAFRINLGILIFGCLVVAVSFVTAVWKNSWEAVSFGGFGIAGIVASLITSPLKTISAAAERLIHLQAVYIGFMNVISMVNETVPESEAVRNDRRERVELLNTSTETLLKVLKGSS
jgi:hypothetical protein